MKKIKDLEIIDLDSELEEGTSQTEEKTENKKKKAATPEPEEEERPDLMDILTGKLGHIIFILIILIFVGLIVYKVWNWGTTVKSEYDPNNISDEYEIEVLDNFVPLINETDIVGVDDGKTTIVAFGNAPFSDDRDSEDNLARLIEEKTGATVINCAIPDTYLAFEGSSVESPESVMDIFNLYWLTTIACFDSDILYYYTEEQIESFPAEAVEVVEQLKTIDWETVDVITIMYDGSDYLDGREVYDIEHQTDIHTTYGNLCASIELFQQCYPYIRIIVMSPTYAFGIDDDGEYISSDIKIYNEHPLSTYAGMMERGAYLHYVTYLDHIYGTVHEDNATQYLIDNIHLNLDGRHAVAERFKFALEYFN
ncbi:MAG: SGNH/GDSL hydrolase family protein [Lachnospiraceae bacterium]|nr:SGNH/GDSL hydrolase family protein [Lachnospiraceae bacterium]